MRKYVITSWESHFDYDGLYNDFKILGTYQDKYEAIHEVILLSEKLIKDEVEREKKSNKRSYQEFDPGESKKHDGKIHKFYSSPNNDNKVVFCDLRSIYDESLRDYNKSYYAIEAVEFPVETELTPELFNLGDCEYEVRSWFKKQKDAA